MQPAAPLHEVLEGPAPAPGSWGLRGPKPPPLPREQMRPQLPPVTYCGPAWPRTVVLRLGFVPGGEHGGALQFGGGWVRQGRRREVMDTWSPPSVTLELHSQPSPTWPQGSIPEQACLPPTRFRSSEPACGRCPWDGRAPSGRSQPGSLLLRSGLLWEGRGRSGRPVPPLQHGAAAQRGEPPPGGGGARGRSEGGRQWGGNSITYRRWAGQGTERGALEAWGCPALPAFADRFARRSCCEVCGGSTGVPGGRGRGAEVTRWGLPTPQRVTWQSPCAPPSTPARVPMQPHQGATWRGQPERAGPLRPHWC